MTINGCSHGKIGEHDQSDYDNLQSSLVIKKWVVFRFCQQAMFDYRRISPVGVTALTSFTQVDELQVAAGAKRSELMGHSELPGDQDMADVASVGARGNSVETLVATGDSVDF